MFQQADVAKGRLPLAEFGCRRWHRQPPRPNSHPRVQYKLWLSLFISSSLLSSFFHCSRNLSKMDPKSQHNYHVFLKCYRFQIDLVLSSYLFIQRKLIKNWCLILASGQKKKNEIKNRQCSTRLCNNGRHWTKTRARPLWNRRADQYLLPARNTSKNIITPFVVIENSS